MMSSILLLSFSANAQIQRQEKVPSFYVPQKDLPQHLSASKKNETFEKTNDTKAIEEKSISEETPVATFQKKYDVYHNNIIILQETGRLPKDQELDETLAKANSNDHFVVTQEK